MRTKRLIQFIIVLVLLSITFAVARGAQAPGSQEDAIGQTPPRLSFTTGEVSFWRPGAQDWSQAQVNTPLAPFLSLCFKTSSPFKILKIPNDLLQTTLSASIRRELAVSS